LIVPKNFNLEKNKQIKQKLINLQKETENKLEEILQSKENYIEKHEKIHSNYSTNPSSQCISQNISPEGDIKKNLKENHNNNYYDNIDNNEISYSKLRNRIILSGKNIFENFNTIEKNPFNIYNNSKMNINTKSFYPKNDKFNLNKNYNYNFANQNMNINLNNNKNCNKNIDSGNNNIFYDKSLNYKNLKNTQNLINNNIKNNFIYDDSNNIYKNIYSNFYNFNNYNNFNLQEYQFYRQQIKLQSQQPTNCNLNYNIINNHTIDPFSVLRENNYLIKINGKNVPFEEPHNRINLENVIKK